MFRLSVLFVFVLALTGCGSPPSPASTPINDPTALLVQNGWTLGGGAETAPFTVPTGSYDTAAQALLDASKAVGLDFSALAGKELAIQSYPLNEASSGGQPVRGNVLMDGANVVGAWLSVGDQVYALNTKP